VLAFESASGGNDALVLYDGQRFMYYDDNILEAFTVFQAVSGVNEWHLVCGHVLFVMMMMISPFGHKAVGDLSGVSETYSRQSHSPIVEASDNPLCNSSQGLRYCCE
jgi:hypothetical protein